MKRILLLSFALCAQFFLSQVTIEKNKLVKENVKYKFSQYEQAFSNPEAEAYFKKARTNKTFSEICAYTGGAALGFGLATLISGKENTIYANGMAYTKQAKKGGWRFLATGLGLIGVGIPLALAADKNAKKALQTENGEAITSNRISKLKLPETAWR